MTHADEMALYADVERLVRRLAADPDARAELADAVLTAVRRYGVARLGRGIVIGRRQEREQSS